MKPVFSLKMAFLLVSIAALACAVIATGSVQLSRLFATGVFVFVMSGPVGVYCRKGADRAFWLGVTTFGVGYYIFFRLEWGGLIDEMAEGLLRGLGTPSREVMVLLNFNFVWWTLFFAFVGGLIGKYILYREGDEGKNE